MPDRETMQFDVVIVGAGPAGLAAACRLGQLARAAGRALSIGVVEKGAAVGAHILSGAVIETRALDELFPDWRERGAPLKIEARADRVEWLLGERLALRVPQAFVPRVLCNHGNYIASVGRLCVWLAEQAELLGCDVLPGFAAVDVLCDDKGRIRGVVTGDMGVARDGTRKDNYQPGYELQAKYVIFAEGCRGTLGRVLEQRYALRAQADPQHYGLGLKEIWEIDPARHEQGTVMHTLGWPLDRRTEGGGFVYHADDHQLYLGFVVALNYRNPWLSPFEEFQRWKTHPRIRTLLEGGRRIAFGARAVNKGGLQSLPKLSMPGGLLVGCEAGFLNGAKIKGTHTAIKTGMLAAEAVFEALGYEDAGGTDLESYGARVRASWIWDELHAARNFSPGFARFGTFGGAALAFVEHNLLRGRVPWTLHNHRRDRDCLLPAARIRPIRYPKPDGRISFDRLSSVYLSSTLHEEDQPCHLELADPTLPVAHNLPVYAEPAQRYCPANVYEIVGAGTTEARLQINASNCVHCKACEIKDPAGNIRWVPPEGCGGPGYVGM
jgi:electron-transferring-flavoprotein dehydrogenase